MRSGNVLSDEFPDAGFTDGYFEAWGEKHTSATVGSPGAQDQLTDAVDLGRGTGSAGFMGKMSEVSWIQRAKEHLLAMPLAPGENMETMQIQYDRHTRDAKKSNYFMDDFDLLSVDEDHVIAEEMPPQELSFILAEACFHAIQGAFAFVHREQFLDALAHFPRKQSPLSWVERRWLALANLVFALGAKWLQQTEPDGGLFVHNHLEFYARARALGLDHRIVFDHPVLEQVQSLGLLAFYLFVNGSIFRYVGPTCCSGHLLTIVQIMDDSGPRAPSRHRVGLALTSGRQYDKFYRQDYQGTNLALTVLLGDLNLRGYWPASRGCSFRYHHPN
jgi:hypothetical protein